MQIHKSKTKALKSLAREMEKVTQFSHLLSNSPERQALVRYCWALTQSNAEQRSLEPSETFDRFLQIFSGQDSDIRFKLSPVTHGKSLTTQTLSYGLNLLNQAGIDALSLNSDIQNQACDFISALSYYHNEIYNKHKNSLKGQAVKPFSLFVKEKQISIQKALLHNNPEKAIDSFAYELMKSYIPEFDLSKIAFHNGKDNGNVIYNDPNACSVLNIMQSALKFDLKSMGVDTSNYQQSNTMSNLKLGQARKILPSDQVSETTIMKARVAKNEHSEDLGI